LKVKELHVAALKSLFWLQLAPLHLTNGAIIGPIATAIQAGTPFILTNLLDPKTVQMKSLSCLCCSGVLMVGGNNANVGRPAAAATVCAPVGTPGNMIATWGGY
jgi:hypothetical protein